MGVTTSVHAQQSTGDRYYPETGHWVRGPFLEFYDSADDPLLIFGYPITDQFTDPLTGQQVQYFQKVRLDLANTLEGQVVQLAPLGSLLHDNTAPLAGISQEDPTCRLFPNTGISVCYAFLQFYDSYDGATYFGDPISQVEVREGRYVQYFEYARLEWHPDHQVGQRVALTDLGRIYFDQIVANPALLKPQADSNIITNSMLQPKVLAFASNALTESGTQQTISVLVVDQYLRPIEDATVILYVNLPGGKREVYYPAATDVIGLSTMTLLVPDLPVNTIVSIDVEISYQGQQTHGSTWYRIWW